MTMPLGAACFMASMYSLMRGLSLPWQSRRTTRAERLDFRCLRELLQRNLGRGFFSLDQFGEAPVVDTDRTRQRAGHTLGVVMLHAAGATDSFATAQPRSAI